MLHILLSNQIHEVQRPEWISSPVTFKDKHLDVQEKQAIWYLSVSPQVLFSYYQFTLTWIDLWGFNDVGGYITYTEETFLAMKYLHFSLGHIIM